MTLYRNSPFWISTYTGKKFSLTNPHLDDICIEDIAHSLSLTNRYNGHTEQAYSVAQHSLVVSLLCPPELALEGLMHDAGEAYTGDIVRPLKRLLQPSQHDLNNHLEDIEYYIEAAIAEKFKLENNALIKEYDTLALFIEKQHLNKNWKDVTWLDDAQMDQRYREVCENFQLTKLIQYIIQYRHPAMVEAQFLGWFNRLWEKRQSVSVA
jgi:5'-deoxynucleotidase YfbR-like HD superfamily hydrolase